MWTPNIAPRTPESKRTTFERWTLDPATAAGRRSLHSEFAQEFPRFDERLAGCPYRYGYTVSFDGLASKLYCYDLAANRPPSTTTAPAASRARPYSLRARRRGRRLDSLLRLRPRDRRRDIVILNAGDVAGEPAAVAHLPVRVPLGFHGNWIPDED